MNWRTIPTTMQLGFLLKVALFLWMSMQSTVGIGQTLTIQELLAKRDQWPGFATDGSKFQFEGRFEGRSGDTIRIQKFDIVCHLPSNATFPERIRSGQRIDVTGRFLADSGRLSFVVTRILIRETDIDQLRLRAKGIPADQPDKLIVLAAEFQADADFYEDAALQAEINAVRSDGIARLRKFARGNAAKLRALLNQAIELGVKPELLELLRFETIYETVRSPMADVESLVAELKQSCEGWDRIVLPVSEAVRMAYEKNAIIAFESAFPADRRQMHRLLYKSLRMSQYQSMIAKDGSNGLELAKLIRTEFGDDDPLAADFEEREIRFRLTTRTSLSRAELKTLIDLLTRLNRSQQTPDLVRDWVLAQAQKFGTSNLASTLRTADEYLFAADLVQSDEYQQKGVELLKQAWLNAHETSPADADQIADRLKRLGWERLNDQWLTNAQLSSLPKDDVQLAIREGRVVRGMTIQQVVQTLGQPARISRIGSRKSVFELWSYDALGSGVMVVRFRRSPSDDGTAAIVEDVSRVTQRPRK